MACGGWYVLLHDHWAASFSDGKAALVAESQRAALAAVSSKRRSVDDRAFDSAVMTASVGVHDTPEQMRLKAAALGKRPRGYMRPTANQWLAVSAPQANGKRKAPE